jgi:hypothetical protein
MSMPQELDGTGMVEEELPLLAEKLDKLEKLGRFVNGFLSILSLLDMRCKNVNFGSSGAPACDSSFAAEEGVVD